MVDRASPTPPSRSRPARSARRSRAGSASRIVKVDEIEPASTRPFEEVAAELKRDLADRARQERDRQRAGQDRGRARSAARRSPRPRRSSSSSRAPSRRSTAPARMPDGNAVPDLPQNVDVLSAAFAADVGGENEPLRAAETAAMSGSTSTAITPARDRPLDEVKDQVVARWRDDEIATRLQAKADRDAGQAQGRHVVRGRRPRPTSSRSNGAPGIKRGAAADRAVGRRPSPRFSRTPKDAAGSAEGDEPDRADRVPRHRDHGAAARCRSRAEAKRIDEALRARISRRPDRRNIIARLQSDLGVTINQSALNQVTGGGTQN